MRENIFYILIIGITSGILFRSFFNIGFLDIVFLLFLSLMLLVMWRLQKRTVASSTFILSIVLLVIAIGIIRIDLSEKNISPLRDAVRETKVWEGIVVREPDQRNSSTHLYVREKETGALILVIADPFLLVAYGDQISVRGTLTKPEPFETDTGRTFNYVGYLKAQGVREMISYGSVTVVGHGKGNIILARLYQVKAALMEALERAIPEPAAGLGEGLLLGVKRALGDDLIEIFRVAGIVHIVVLSGYNIMIVADSVMRFLGYFFFPRTRLILGIASIIFFALLVGLSATVVRASIMASLVLIARNTGRNYIVLRALCLTGLMMLFLNPYLLAFDPGFQLSFLATLGLILIAPQFEKRLSFIPSTWGVRGYLATTLGTQLYVFPVLLYSMGTLSVVSIAVNILVLPLVPVAMLTTFVVGIIGLVSHTAALIMGFVPYIVLMYVIKLATVVAALPFASVTIPSFHIIFVFLMYTAIGIFTYRLLPKLNDKEGTQTILENDYEDWIIEEENRVSPIFPR